MDPISCLYFDTAIETLENSTIDGNMSSSIDICQQLDKIHHHQLNCLVLLYHEQFAETKYDATDDSYYLYIGAKREYSCIFYPVITVFSDLKRPLHCNQTSLNREIRM